MSASYQEQIAGVKREIVMYKARGNKVTTGWLEAVLKTLERDEKLEPVLRQIQKCANEHREECVHCSSVAMVMEEVMGFLGK